MRRRSIERLFVFVVDLLLSFTIDIGAVDAPSRVAEVGTVGETDGGGEHMTDGADGTVGEVHHTVDFGGEVGACTEVDQVAEAVDGVGLHAILNPLLFDAFEVHVVVEGQVIGPREVLEQLDGGADGHPVRDACLHMVAYHRSGPTAKVVGEAAEEHGVRIVDICLSVHRVAHAEALVPTFLARLADILKRIEGVDRQSQLGQ